VKKLQKCLYGNGKSHPATATDAKTQDPVYDVTNKWIGYHSDVKKVVFLLN
jgi:hypothetical protein